MCVKWQNAMQDWFSISNGTRQGGVLSPAFFARYIREVLNEIMASGVGCHIGDVCFNVLAYADDLVLLAPSWAAMQQLIDMTCNVTKTVSMVFNPLCRRKVVANSFPLLKLGSSYIHFVDCFKYLGHIITDNARDDDDIKREVRNLFVRTNVLICSCGRAGGPVAHGMGPQSLRPWTINMCDLE